MRKLWIAPVLETYGTVVELTQVIKKPGIYDGTMLCITVDGQNQIVPGESCGPNC
jgi:hypothetical protein